MNSPESGSLDQLASELASRIPEHIKGMTDDMRHNLKPVLHNALSRFDLVTREEFEAQQRLLQRARGQLANLQAEIERLEARLK